MSITAVDTVCTDQDLSRRLTGGDTLKELFPKGQVNAQATRQDVLDRVLRALKGRTPPINETDLQDPTELRDAVAFGTLAELYFGAFVEEGDPRHIRAKRFDAMYKSEVSSLRPTVTHGQIGASMSIAIHRR